MLGRLFVLFNLSTASVGAMASDRICIVNAEYALHEVSQGKKLEKELEDRVAALQADLEKAQAAFKKEVEEFQGQAEAKILSPEALAKRGAELEQKQAALESTFGGREQELQAYYNASAASLQERFATVATQVGARKGCALMFDKSATYFVGPTITDLTEDIIKEFDQTYR